MKRLNLLFLIFVLVGSMEARYQGDVKHTRVHKGSPTQTLYNVNTISGWIYWDGRSGNDPYGNYGITFPRFTAGVVFQDGIVWGGIVHDGTQPTMRVGGQTYNIGTQPGRIISVGVPANPMNPDVRIYRIRRDWQTVSDSVLRLDAAELNMIPPGMVTQSMIDAVRQQYATDWNEWPVQYGAPYYDHNGNGVYDPGVDEPGIAGADQVIWFVANDLDSSSTSALYGSPPMGLELQVTIWAYDRTEGVLANAVFRRYRLINKSGFPIDSMFVAQWVDPDVGDYTDDLLGCDSTLELGYAYNGYPVDSDYQAYGLPPAAVGYMLWQGPIVPSPGDTAYFNFSPRPNYRNLPLTSFGYFSAGSGISDPSLGIYEGTLQWYNLLNGYIPTQDTLNPSPYVHQAGPHAGQPTFFPLNGDPLTGTGDVDGTGNNPVPGDRRMVLSSGPFTLAPGDTQEIIIVLMGGMEPTGDYLVSVERVRSYAAQIKPMLGQPLEIPEVQYVSEHSPDSTSLQIQANLTGFPGASQCTLTFDPFWGNEPSFTVSLYDDGMHNDGGAGDGIWGNTTTVLNRQYPYNATLTVEESGATLTFPQVLSMVRVRPAPQPKNWAVVWENGLQDGQVNPGEKVHIGFAIQNPDSVNNISSLTIRDEFYEITYPGTIPPGGTVVHDSLFTVQKAPQQGDSFLVSFKMKFDFNVVTVEKMFPIAPWNPPTNWGDTLWVFPIRGASSNVIPLVTDPTQMTGHTYLVIFTGDSLNLRWNLIDETTGDVKLSNQLPGNSVDDDFPIVDGVEWNVVYREPGIEAIVQVANRLGPLDPSDWDAQGAPYHGNNVWHSLSAPSDLNRFYMSAGGGNGTIDRIIRSIENAHNHDFEIRFTTDGGIYLWWYDDDTWQYVPFEAWDVGIGTYDDPSDDIRCLTGGYSGGSATGVGGFTFDYTDPYFGYPATDWIYIRVPLDSMGSYAAFENDVLSGTLNFDWWSHTEEVLARLIFCDYTGNNLLPETGTVIRFITNKINYPGDSVRVITDSTLSTGPTRPIYRFDLAQNYPNPFNPTTTVRFSVARPVPVKLEIFNVLGQKVRTLIDRKMAPGVYRVVWNGCNDARVPLGSGVYFYRLKAGEYVKVRKMVLIR